MPTATRGLSTSDLEHIRDALAGGRKPKVVFTAAAGQVAGQLGQVVQLTDPQHSEDWVVVRFGRDELPFSPADLAIAPRAVPARRAGRDASAAVSAPAGGPGEATRSGKDTAGAPGEADRPGRDTAAAAAEDHPAAPSTVDGNGGPVASAGVDAAPARPRTAVRKAAKPKPPAALTVTLAYADGEWTVAAQQGSKALARPYVIKPGEALKMVSLLDVPGVHEAVEEILATARAEAAAAAERLRAQLAEVEARLAELGDTR
jgi:hypothetical protein